MINKFWNLGDLSYENGLISSTHPEYAPAEAP